MEKQKYDSSNISPSSRLFFRVAKSPNNSLGILKTKDASNLKQNCKQVRNWLKQPHKFKLIQRSTRQQSRKLLTSLKLEEFQSSKQNNRLSKVEERVIPQNSYQTHLTPKIQTNRVMIGKLTQQKTKQKYGTSALNVYTHTPSLPLLNKHKYIEKKSQKKNNKEINMIEMGIFSDVKAIQIFLRKFKNTLVHQFGGTINIKDEQDIKRIQFLLLKQIHNEGHWLNE